MIRIITQACLAAFLMLAVFAIPRPSVSQTIDEEITRIIRESSLIEQDVRCLAKNIYYEARNEPKEGKVAVGVVTLNRVENPLYPKTICDVVNHRTKNREGKTVCQFSWTCMRLSKPKESDPLWLESIRIAKNLLLGEYDHWEKKYERAHHFHNTSVNPGWNRRIIARIGRHIFYH